MVASRPTSGRQGPPTRYVPLFAPSLSHAVLSLQLLLQCTTTMTTLCDLEGNWTSGVGPAGQLVHIEIWQAPKSSTFVVAAPWENHSGFRTTGHLLSDGRAAVYMVLPGNEGGIWQYSEVTTSPHRNPRSVPCTKIFNWCRFPYCQEREPKQWPSWPTNPRPVPLPPLPVPEPLLSCADNASIPCPVPSWSPVWDLARSTALMACNLSGPYDPALAARWGLVSFDALNEQAEWLAVTPHDAEERLAEQCRRVKAVNPSTKCMVYRNTALALEWMSSQRRVMDAAHASFFLQFQDTADSSAAAKCTAAGPCTYAPEPGRPPYSGAGSLHGGPFCCPFGNTTSIYCEMGGTTITSHWRGQQQYFWNFSDSHLQEWWVTHFFFGENGVSNQAIDGCFSDDVMGLPQEHPDAVARLGLSIAQLSQLQRDTQRVWNRAVQSLIMANGFSWQLFGVSDYAAAPPSDSDSLACTKQMRKWCDPARQRLPLLMGLHGHCCGLGYSGSAPLEDCARHNINFTLAAFLIVRPPHGYLGSGWLGCDAAGQQRVHTWETMFDLDVGEPQSLCHEPSPGIFSRNWSKGSAWMDCNSFHTSLNFSLKSHSKSLS